MKGLLKDKDVVIEEFMKEFEIEKVEFDEWIVYFFYYKSRFKI